MTTMQRIAEAMGCAPADDDDLVEAVRLLVSERDAAVAAERARCAAACREVAAREAGYRNLMARDAAETCAEAIERGAAERRFHLQLSDGADGWVPASAHGMLDQYVTRDAAWDAARAAFCDTEHLSLMCRVVERGPIAPGVG